MTDRDKDRVDGGGLEEQQNIIRNVSLALRGPRLTEDQIIGFLSGLESDLHHAKAEHPPQIDADKLVGSGAYIKKIVDQLCKHVDSCLVIDDLDYLWGFEDKKCREGVTEVIKYMLAALPACTVDMRAAVERLAEELWRERSGRDYLTGQTLASWVSVEELRDDLTAALERARREK